MLHLDSMKRSRSDNSTTSYRRKSGVGKKRARLSPRTGAYSVNYLRRARMNRRTGGLLGLEYKFYDTSLVASALTSPTDCSGGEHDPATVLCLSAPAQGSSEIQRVGRSIRICRLDVVGNCAIPETSAKTSLTDMPNIFIAIVLDTQTNGAQLNSEDVYKNTAAEATLATRIYRNMSNTSRFRVLAQKLIRFQDLSATNNTTTGSITQHGCFMPWQFHLKMNLPVKFSVGGTSAGVASVEDNSLHLIAFTNSTAYLPEISYNARIRYSDV